MGGEAALFPKRLADALSAFREVGLVDRFEVVTNGLQPQGLLPATLRQTDRVSISDYGYSDELVAGWRAYVTHEAPAVELISRRHTDGWDAWEEVDAVDDARALSAYETCWYRRHCITIERGRLFLCSRVPKLGRDAEGLLLTDAASIHDIQAYLRSPTALPSCATCGPVLSGRKIAPGVQPDDRIQRLEAKAITWLQARTHRGAVP
jgi:hypothetical protein